MANLHPWSGRILALVLLLCIGGLLFPAAGRDDTHITYWAALSFSQSGRITNYNGDVIEQSSSLLQVFLLGLLHRIWKLDMVTLGHLFSIFFGAASLLALNHLLGRNKIVPSGWARDWIVLITATTPFFVYWTFGGLETTLTAFFIIATISTFDLYVAQESICWPCLASSALVALSLMLTRPEMPFVLNTVLGCALIFFLVRLFLGHQQNTHMLKRFLVLWFICLLVTAGIFAFRLCYFGSLFPQPVLAKSTGFSLQGIYFGTIYLFFTLRSGMFVIVCLAVTSAIYAGYSQLKNPSPDAFLLLTALFALVYLGFILFSGGDWMEAGRFLVPIAPLISLLLLLPLVSFRTKMIPIAILAAWLCIAGLNLFRLVDIESTSVPAWGAIESPATYTSSNYSYFENKNLLNVRGMLILEQLSPLIEKLLASSQRQATKVTIFSGQMGFVPYHLAQEYPGKIKFIDRYGLTDRAITTCPITNNLFRHPLGVSVSYDFFYSNLDRLHAECLLDKPDLIFDIDFPDSVSPASYGYQVVFTQNGWIKSASAWPFNQAVKADYFIAVRVDLLHLVLDKNEP